MAAPHRARVLELYRSILRLSSSWNSSTSLAETPQKLAAEKAYIRSEAALLFRRNACITDAGIIRDKIFEAESRLELAKHYKIPYPRAAYVDHTSTGQNKTVTPLAYMHSYDQTLPSKTSYDDGEWQFHNPDNI